MLAGVASIKAQQTRMNVIGNNLANVNTTAYKSTRITFQDMIAQTIRGASRPTSVPIRMPSPASAARGETPPSCDAPAAATISPAATPNVPMRLVVFMA